MIADTPHRAGLLDWLSVLLLVALVAATVIAVLAVLRVVTWTVPLIPLAVAVTTFVVECVVVGVRGVDAR